MIFPWFIVTTSQQNLAEKIMTTLTKMAIHKSALTKRIISSELEVKSHEFFAEVENEFLGTAEMFLNRIAATQMNRNEENRNGCVEEFLENCKKFWKSKYQSCFN
jgi:hypothetical protein